MIYNLDICGEKLDRGKWCAPMSNRYYYHSKSGVCKGFHYTGCGKSSNNFKTLEECEEVCIKKTKKNFIGIIEKDKSSNGTKSSKYKGVKPKEKQVMNRHITLTASNMSYYKSDPYVADYGHCLGFRYNVTGDFTKLNAYLCLLEESGNCEMQIYPTTPSYQPTYHNDYNAQNVNYNYGSKRLNPDQENYSSKSQPNHETIDYEIKTDKDVIKTINYKPVEIKDSYQTVNPTTPKYIRPSKPVYTPDFNFPLQYATTSSIGIKSIITTTSLNDIIKINMKKQSKESYKKSIPSGYDFNSSIDNSISKPKESQTYKPIVEPMVGKKGMSKNYYETGTEINNEENNNKLAGINFFNDPPLDSLSNNIYDEVIPFNNNEIDQVEVPPANIRLSHHLDYDDKEISLNKSSQARGIKQFMKDNKIDEEDNGLTKIPLESTYERCNNDNLLKIMKNNMITSPIISKQLIFGAWKKEYNENLDVICSKIPFSYTVVSSSVYCEIQTTTLSCFSYIQPKL
uniref:BPTI/Kunitz inhibitor domain-containing protein n=1 Tax=Parastrongyloides trichosuri TaxID=131310 RepID=A0A0N4ZPT6_PARTI